MKYAALEHGDRGPWLALSDRRPFYFLEPRAVSVETIARSLSRIARYAGHTREPYSVAQHSVMVSHLAPAEYAAHGLLHDAAEIVFSDLPSPFKRLLESESGGYLCTLERSIESAIFSGFGLDHEDGHLEVKRADLLALAVEMRDLVPPGERAPELQFSFADVVHLPRIRRCWPPAEAEERFLERWAEVRP